MKMDKIVPIKEIYASGYSKTAWLNNNLRIIEVLSLIDHFIPKNPERILDVGCGDGFLSAELGKISGAKQVFGIDISPAAVKDALGYGIKATALDTDEESLPYEDAYFDFIFCGGLIELVLDPDHLLKELYRLLKERGYLIMTFPNLGAWASRIAVLFGYQPYYSIVSRLYDVGKLLIPLSKYENLSKGFVRLYNLYSFRQLVGKYGFKIVKTRGAGENTIPFFMRFVDMVFSIIPSLSFQVICVLRKDVK